jgi:hypothetical protein
MSRERKNKKMLMQLLQPKQKARPAAADSLNYLSTGFSVMPPSPPLLVSSIWQRYRLGAASEKDLLQGLAKQVAELKVPPPLAAGKFRMATQLAYAPCATKLETADAIEAFMAWADDNGITVVDRASA